MKKGVEKTDLYQLHLLSGLKASPSGNRLVYVHTQMAEASDTYEKNLWLVEGKRKFCIYLSTIEAEVFRLSVGK